jgi:NADH dehydrogenase
VKVLVTGASGYIGQRAVAALRQAGHGVVAAGRRPVAGLPPYRFDLASSELEPLPAGVDVVLHLAADTTGQGDDAAMEREIAASTALVRAAQVAGARFVFVSSQTARADAPTHYGRSKFRIEQQVLAAGGTVVRPGQVYGGREHALFGTLVGLVRGLPVLPAFLPAPRIQPVHVDDLAQALVTAANRADLGGRVLAVGAAEPVSFTTFLRAIASERVRRPRLFVPVPALLVKAARAATGGRVAPLERLGSLFALPPMDSRADLALLGLTLQPLERGMGTRRRALLRECATLLRYVLAERPGSALLRRHARAIERLRAGAVLGLPRSIVAMPGLVRALEGRGAHAGELAWRLDVATALAEATPQGARRFLGLGQRSSWLGAGLGLALAVAGEASWRIAAPVLRPLLRRRHSAA